MFIIENFPGFKIFLEVVFYFILICMIFKYKYKNIALRDKKVFLLIFLFKVIAGILFYITRDNAFGVNTGNDELVYFNFAQEYFKLGEFPILALFDMNRGFIIYDWIHFVVFNEANIMFIIITNIFFSVLIWIVFYKELKILFEQKVTFMILFLSFIPEVMFQNFQNMRDTLILFFVVIFVKVLYNYIAYKKINYFVVFMLIYFTATLRFYNLLIEAAILFIFAMFIIKFRRIQILILSISFLAFIFIIHPGVMDIVFNLLTNFREIVVLNIKAHSDYDFYLLPQFLSADTYNNSLIIKVFLTFIVTPNPYRFFDLGVIEQLVIVSNLLFLSLIFYFTKELINFKKIDNIEKIMIIFIVLYTIIILFWPYLSDYRHRGGIMPFIFILIFKNLFTNKYKISNIITIQLITLSILFLGIGVMI